MDNRASKIKINNVYTEEYGFKPKGRIEIPTAEQNIEQIDIKGRDGSITKKYGFKDIPLPVTFTLLDMSRGFKPTYRKIKQCIFETKTLIFDDDPSVYYKIKGVQIDTAENYIRQFGEFVVNFILDPFMYEVKNDPITITGRRTIHNEGYKTLPIIIAQVSGTGKIYINDQEITVKNVNGSIIIDSMMQNAYRKSPTGLIAENMNKHMIGKFPILQHGDNVIEFDGDISELEVILNKRWR